MKGFAFNKAGSLKAKAAWSSAFPNQRIGSVNELVDTFMSVISGVVVFCTFKLEKALMAQGLLSEGESINDAIARFSPHQQEVLMRFIEPDIEEVHNG